MVRLTVSFALLIGLAGRAQADAKKEAKVHLDKAAAAHKAGRYDEARKELEIAYTLDPQPALLYAIGQVHVMQGQCPQAITFYQRYLDSNPGEAQATKAREAIETCRKLQQPDKPVDKPIEPDRPDKPLVIEKPVTVVTTTRPWYTDIVGDVLVLAGVGAGVAGLVFYRGALADRDEADRVMNYDTYDDLLADANSKQRTSIILSAVGGALVVGGIISYVVRDRSVETRRVTVVPTNDGGVITWSGRF